MTTETANSRQPGSWVITLTDGRVIETFDRATAEQCRGLGAMVEPIGDYLARVNAEIRAATQED